MSLYFCLYTFTAAISDILFYTCEEFEAWGSAHGTKYVEKFLCQKFPNIQTTISFAEGSQVHFLSKKESYKDEDEYKRWWNSINRGKTELLGDKPVHHKSYMDRSGIKAGPPRSKTSNYIVTVYKISIRTSQRTQFASIMKVNRRNALLILGIILLQTK